MSSIVFYHYTSEEGTNAILKSRIIKASNIKAGDAVFGNGVYGTTLDPTRFTKEQVAKNNYDHSEENWMSFLIQGKVNFAFRVILPSKKVMIPDTKRHILLHKGDISLDLYEFQVIEVPEPESNTASEDNCYVDTESEDSSDDEEDSSVMGSIPFSFFSAHTESEDSSDDDDDSSVMGSIPFSFFSAHMESEDSSDDEEESDEDTEREESSDEDAETECEITGIMIQSLNIGVVIADVNNISLSNIFDMMR